MKNSRKKKQGTKFSPVYHFEIKAKQIENIYLRLTNKKQMNHFLKILKILK